MRAAAELLSSSRSVAGVADIVRAAGIGSPPVEMDRATTQALGIEDLTRVELVAGKGAVRVLLAEVDGATSMRTVIQRVARRLSSRAPHVLWLLGVVDRSGIAAGIVGWTNGPRGPRVASFLWEPGRVVDSDAETLCALAAIRADDDGLRHARCVEVLGRDALTRRFYRALESQVGALAAVVKAPADDARDVALLYVSRLLFLCFLEAKGWLDGDRAFLSNRFDACLESGGAFHQRVLLPLFFGTLNTPLRRRAATARGFGQIPFLNGGLFSRTPLERRLGRLEFADEQVGSLLAEVFQRFRFVAREDAADWSEASVDPEMLGRAFESLMRSDDRRAGGVYYTPHDLVARVAEHAIASANLNTLQTLRDIRVLDPACGSGAFLVFVLERLAARRLALGDEAEGGVAAVRRDVLSRSIFGVDRSPTAVWLCELRLWLSVVIESDETDPRRVAPLPNLDRNIRVGDALTGNGFTKDIGANFGGSRATDLRRRYVRATGTRKRSLARALDRDERRRVLRQVEREVDAAAYSRRELLAAQRGRDLFGERAATSSDMRRESKRLRDKLRALRHERRRIADGGALPFSFSAFFADAQACGGFDIVLGNPPWVRLHRIPLALRLQFKRTYEVYRDAHWQSGAAGAHVARGFASQVDLAALFVERSVRLLRDGGIVSLLLPAKLWRSLAGGGLRTFLFTRARVLRLEDLSESRHAFDAAVYPSLVVAAATSAPPALITVGVHDANGDATWQVRPNALAFDDTPGAPWVILRSDARVAFDRIRDAGIPLGQSHFGPPRLGVKSGCNVAFVVRVRDSGRGLTSIQSADGEIGSVETALLRPALRGDAVVPWQRSACEEAIVWTHDADGHPLARLPDRAREWLRRHYGDLAGRSDAARVKRWWSLFRVDAADSRRARVVWADIGRRPRALVLPVADAAVPLNSCYVVRCLDPDDAWALAALLNSDLAACWLNAIAEPARGGYRRYLGWTIGQLPIPRDWQRARAILRDAPRDSPEGLLDAVLRAYGLDRSNVACLLKSDA